MSKTHSQIDTEEQQMISHKQTFQTQKPTWICSSLEEINLSFEEQTDEIVWWVSANSKWLIITQETWWRTVAVYVRVVRSEEQVNQWELNSTSIISCFFWAFITFISLNLLQDFHMQFEVTAVSALVFFIQKSGIKKLLEGHLVQEGPDLQNLLNEMEELQRQRTSRPFLSRSDL